MLDFSKFFRSELLHLGFLGVLDFYAEHKRLPALNNEDEAQQVVKFTEAHNAAFKE